MDIEQRVLEFLTQLPPQVQLVAVSKTQPVMALMEAYRAGQRHFGENRVQELISKKAEMPNDVCWHMIGHLQRNKVRSIIPFIHLIQSVDSAELLTTIDAEAKRAGRVVDVLLQMYIAREETKFGLSEAELLALINRKKAGEFGHVRMCGLMGMASFVDDKTQVAAEFQALKLMFDRIRSQVDAEVFKVISMGMSGDYRLAIEQGSTLVRVGSALFGNR